MIPEPLRPLPQEPPAGHGLPRLTRDPNPDRPANLTHLTDDDRHTLLDDIDALTTKAKLRLLTGGGAG